MLQKTLSILLLLLLVSCQSKTGNPKTKDLYKEEINQGSNVFKTLRTYGKYSNSWNDENGNKVYQYYYSKSGYDLVSKLPIINHFGFIKSENYEVLLVVDNKDLLLEKINFYNRAKSENSLVCNPQIYSCLKKVY